MKLFSAIKPCLNNLSAAKCYKARTITRWLLFIIFLEKATINICRLLLFSFIICILILCMSVFVLSPHFNGWWAIIDSSYWSKGGNNDFVILFLAFPLFQSNALKSLSLWCPCCYWDTVGLLFASTLHRIKPVCLSIWLSKCLKSKTSMKLKQTL